jgi:hypothetical protein
MARNNIRQKFSSYLFFKESTALQRTAEVTSFERAKSIGIIYDSTSETNYELVKQLVKDFRDVHKDVQSLGFIDLKEIPQNRFVKLGLDFFTKKDLNWKMKPSGAAVDNFSKTEFDILICLNIGKCIPLKYIASQSRARFKIGRYNERLAYLYDFMISVEDPTDLGSFVHQLKHYLFQVKNENSQKA